MNFNGFIGPSYRPSAYAIDTQVTKNWYTERVESGNGKNAYGLLRAPGRKLFLDPTVGPGIVRAMFAIEGYLFAVINQHVMEMMPDGTFNIFPTLIANDGRPAYINGNSDQVLFVSAGHGYILQGGVLTEIADPGFPKGTARNAAYLDGYFAVSIAGTKFFQISNLNDGTKWDSTQKAAKDAKLDFIHNISALNREIWTYGSQSTQVFDDVGDVDFPFSVRTDVEIDMGIWADDSLVNLGNTHYLVAGNNIGINMVMRTEGYAMKRVSDHPIEQFLDKNKASYDFVGWCYEENGHLFYVLYSPSADKTLCLDVSTMQWTERTWLDPNTGVEHAHRGYCSATIFNRILVGDRIDGKIYEMSMDFLDDAGDLIRRTRRAPCIDQELLNITHSSFQLDANMGLGGDGITDHDDPMYDPKMMLRWSNDGGQTFGNEHWRGFGRIGEFKRRAIWRQLGYARRRVYESIVTAPADWGIAACYVNQEANG